MPSHALVLTAGLGTRLQPLTFVRAKPALPVAGEPLICRIASWLSGHGVNDLVLNLHHLPQTLTAIVGDGSDLGVRARYSWEQPAVLGSAGGPRRALPIVGADPFFIVNGDTLTDVDLHALATAHQASDALVTLALVPNREPDKYGGVLVSPDGRVTGFVGRGPRAAGSFHFIGVQVAAAAAFAALPDGQPLNSVGDVYNRLLELRPGAIRAFVCDASFQDIGTVSDYQATFFSLLEGRSPNDAYGRNVRLGSHATVTRSILWDDVHVGDNAVLDDCIVTDGVRIPAGAVYHRSVLRNDGGTLAVTPL